MSQKTPKIIITTNHPVLNPEWEPAIARVGEAARAATPKLEEVIKHLNDLPHVFKKHG